MKVVRDIWRIPGTENANSWTKMALMDKDDVKRAIYVVSTLSVMLILALLVLIETGVIFADAK